MPGGDGMGPAGTGRGQGRGLGTFAGGYCKCPNCGTKVEHKRGEPCVSKKCPKCETMMVRE